MNLILDAQGRPILDETDLLMAESMRATSEYLYGLRSGEAMRLSGVTCDPVIYGPDGEVVSHIKTFELAGLERWLPETQ